MINWITENVAIGDYLDACNRENLLREKIDCVLSLKVTETLGEYILCTQNNIGFYKIPIGRQFMDDEGIEPIKIELRTAAYMLELLTTKYKKILVHCTGGIDRAPFVVARYLANKKVELDRIMDSNTGDYRDWIIEAYKTIRKKRPQIREHFEWI